jgi:hypothetical protein
LKCGRVGNLPGQFALEDRTTGAGLLRFFAKLRGAGNPGLVRELVERFVADLSMGTSTRDPSRLARRRGPEGRGSKGVFTQHSQPDALVKLAARHRLVGLKYERPSLKEIFLTPTTR